MPGSFAHVVEEPMWVSVDARTKSSFKLPSAQGTLEDFPPLSSPKPLTVAPQVRNSLKDSKVSSIFQKSIAANASRVFEKMGLQANNTDADVKLSTKEDKVEDVLLETSESAKSSQYDSTAGLKSDLSREEIRALEQESSKNSHEKSQMLEKLDINAARFVAGRDISGRSATEGNAILKGNNVNEEGNTLPEDRYLTNPSTEAAFAYNTSKAPRTLRVVDSAKQETNQKPHTTKWSGPQADSNACASTSWPKEGSRRPSIASVNLPSTPSNEPHSETASYTESHPDSPAGGKSSTGLPRAKTKSRAKKERRAKRTEESKLSESFNADIPGDDIIQEAIIGRKKKTKREKAFVAKPLKQKTHTGSNADIQIAKTEEEGLVTSDRYERKSPVSVSPAQYEGLSAKMSSPKERVEGVNMGTMLDEMVKSGELHCDAVSLVLNSSGLKSNTPVPILQTTVPRLSASEKAVLDSGKPIVVMSVVPGDEDGSKIANHPYPYSIVLPNLERTILPMATKNEADMSISLYTNIMDKGVNCIAPSPACLAIEALTSRPLQLQDLSPLELALSYFSNMQEIFPDDNGPCRETSGRVSVGQIGERSYLDAEDEMIAVNPASHRWMEESAREIQSIDAALGGNYFDRVRAAALGHGPVRLEPTGRNPPSTAAASPSPAPLPPMATHPILGLRTLDNSTNANSDNHNLPKFGSSELWDMFKHQLDIIGEPLLNQNLERELEILDLKDAEEKIKEVEGYVAHLRREADSADKKVAGLVKKHNRQLGLQGKVAAR